MSQVLDDTGAIGAGSSERAPRSASNFTINIAGLLVGLLTLWLLRDLPMAPVLRGCVAALLTFATIGGYDLFVTRVAQRTSTGISNQRLRLLSLKRVAVRLLGLASVLTIIGATYWAVPEYHGAFYQPFWTVLKTFGPGILICTPFYFIWMDTRQHESDDAYLQWGRCLIGTSVPEKWHDIREMVAGWVVKAYFLPLMMVYFAGQVATFSVMQPSWNPGGLGLFTYIYNLSFTIDLLFTVIGYVCTIRLFDSHIRTVEPTTFGWVIALICYQPFFAVMNSAYLDYQGTLHWDNAFSSWPAVRFIWGATILALCVIYGLCTCAFGLRFSNLTNRGIITSGPYRWTKHPAYITKCLSFWMISVPFMEPLGWQLAARHCAALALINLIYYLRAKTEERHLMREPEYQAYAQWIAEQGIAARMRRLWS